jgi:gamma-glutamyltranspeptidase/glutathione hydrolase
MVSRTTFWAFLVVFSLIAYSCSPVARNGMVVSADSLASEAGIEVLKQGGNAVDAAVAVGFALAVTFPEAGNIGGGGFMLIRLTDGRTTMIDFREKAPSAAFATMFQDAEGNIIEDKSLVGPLAAGVPGAVAGLLTALERYGTMSREQVLKRAITLASQGFIVDHRLAASIGSSLPHLEKFASSRLVFTHGGTTYRPGDLFQQPDLARTLSAIRDNGKSGFYKGWVADSVVAMMKTLGGMISHEDLERYEAIERQPVRGTYRGYEIISSAPPSAGGTVLLEILNILEGFDLASHGFRSPSALNLFAAASQAAYIDRRAYMGDPDFVDVPLTRLISKEYASARRMGIDTTHALPSSGLEPGRIEPAKPHETTHFCVADAYGNVVSTTVTVNSLYGSKVVVGGAGFVLNNEMDDFSTRVGAPDQFGLVGGEPNAIAPGKRMVSSMTPTIVLHDGAPLLLLGARGGSRITTAVAQILVNIIDFGLDPQTAVNAARIHYQAIPDTIEYESPGISEETLEGLEHIGYALKKSSSSNGRAEALWIKPRDRVFVGVPDPREGGVAIGY